MPRSFLLTATLFTLASSAMASSHLIFLGTYTAKNPASKGIYSIRLDGETGQLSAPVLATEAVDPAWVALTPDRRRLYTIHASNAQAIGFNVNAAAGTLSPLPSTPAAAIKANAPSHLAVDATGRVLLAANYREGFAAAIPIAADGSLGQPNVVRHEGKGVNPERQEKPHVHSVTLAPDNRFVIVADLGLDRVYSYALDLGAAQLSPAQQPFASVAPGAGARHFKFSPDGRRGYVINEMGGSLTAFDYDAATGALTPFQTISTLPADFQGLKWCAEVRVHPDGRFLYASNRTHDSIAVFAIDARGALQLVEIVPSGAKTPRNFALSPDGRWLVCGHQDTALLTVFAVDAQTGRLTRTPHTAAVEACVCVAFVD
jgi:6-phosphogluconolactonase